VSRRLLQRTIGRRGAAWLLPIVLLALPACLVATATTGEPAADGLVLRTEIAVPAPTPPPPAFELPTGFDPYIYRPTGERADPINIIFLHTDAATAAATAQRVLGWRPIVATGMSFKHKSGTRPTQRQLAADLGPQSRYHLRIQSVPITDTQTFVLASVHRDDTAPCGHVGRAFDEMRDLVARHFGEAGYPTRIVDLGNTAAGPHCDGSRVGGDGTAVLIDLSGVPRVDTPLPNRVPGVQ
jgi:hypothetical protein